jgi:outer membrane protein TolC
MSFSSGHRPVIRAIVVNVVLAFNAYAQHDIPLTLAQAEDLALDNEPGQAAMLARADALAEQSIAAGQLPDPTMRIGLNNYPIQSGGFSTEPMTNASLGFRQAFPPGDTRELGTRRFESMADEMTASAGARARDVLAATRAAWLEAYYWQRAEAIVSETRPFFDDLAAITQSLYAVGRRNQHDVLRAELERSRLDDRLLEISRQRAGARAALAEWIGDDAARPIAIRLPAWDTLPAREDMLERLLEHPALAAADARIASQDAAVGLAEQKYKPGWALDLGYSYREGYLADGGPRPDFISLQVSIDLPYFGHKNRHDRSLAAALSERRAAADSREALRRHLASELDAEFSRWVDIDRRVALYEDRILPQTAEQAEASLVAYQSDRGDFADVMRGYIDDLNARLDHIRLQVERAQSYAQLASLGGLPR